MRLEQKNEIPSGYVWKECLEINAYFPMPDKWFFLAIHKNDTLAFFMTKESIPQQGMFITGLSINVFQGIKQKTGKSAVEFTEGLMRTFPLIPLSRITKIEDNPLVIFRRFFTMPIAQRVLIPQFGKETIGKLMAPTNFYVETVANRKTDTAYIVQFETPVEKWEEDRQIARVMVENGILDKSI